MLISKRNVLAFISGLVLTLGLGSTLHADPGGKVIVIPLFDDGDSSSPPGGAKSTVIYVAKSGGSYTNLQSAMNSVNNSSASNPYTIFVAPGVYTLTSTLQLKPYVHIQGSGKYATIIEGSLSGDAIGLVTGAALISGHDGGRLSHLTLINDTYVEADSKRAEYTIGIYNLNTSVNVNDVDIYVYSDSPLLPGSTQGEQFVTSIGIFNDGSASNFENVTVLVDSLDIAYGAQVSNSSGKMKNVVLDSHGVNFVGYGSFNTNQSRMEYEDSRIFGGTLSTRTSYSLIVTGSAAGTRIRNTQIGSLGNGSSGASTPGSQCNKTYDENLQAVNC